MADSLHSAHILVVDAQPHDCDPLIDCLRREGYRVLAASGQTLDAEIARSIPDMILLDVSEMGAAGWQVLRSLKEDPATASLPVIVLRNNGTEADEIAALTLGAEAFLLKPVSMHPLLARIRTILRCRRQARDEDERIQLQELSLHLSDYSATIGGRKLYFRRKEFMALVYLVQNRNRVISREELLAAVWGADARVIDRTVDVHIQKIRIKLGPYARCIQTIRGVGYRFRLTVS